MAWTLQPARSTKANIKENGKCELLLQQQDITAKQPTISCMSKLENTLYTANIECQCNDSVLWGALDLRHVFWAKKVLVFGAMEDITNDEYLVRS